jgi:hypothetical protein
MGWKCLKCVVVALGLAHLPMLRILIRDCCDANQRGKTEMEHFSNSLIKQVHISKLAGTLGKML